MKIRSHILALALVPVFAVGSPVKAEDYSPAPWLHLIGQTDKCKAKCRRTRNGCLSNDSKVEAYCEQRYWNCVTQCMER